VRANNSVAYFLPGNIGGVYGRVMVAPSEGIAGQKYEGGLIGWAGGPVEVAAGYGQTKTALSGGTDYKVWNVGATYDFGFLKLYGLYNENKYDPLALKTFELSAGIPIGLGAVNLSYTDGKLTGLASGVTPKATQFGAQYLYNMSKRTALYATVAHLSNKNGAAIGLGDLAVSANQSVTGLQRRRPSLVLIDRPGPDRVPDDQTALRGGFFFAGRTHLRVAAGGARHVNCE